MWMILGFGALGLLIGTLVGLTSEPVVASTIGLLFSAVGGSVVLFVHKLNKDDRRLAGQMIFTLALWTLAGTIGGILISEHRVLSPIVARNSPTDNKYLRSAIFTEITAIDVEYNDHAITAEQAYSRIRAAIAREQKQ
jgi:hypothetical protein